MVWSPGDPLSLGRPLQSRGCSVYFRAPVQGSGGVGVFLSQPQSHLLPGLSLGPTRCLFWTAIIMMMAVSPVEMTPSAENPSLSSSFPHTLVSAAVLHIQAPHSSSPDLWKPVTGLPPTLQLPVL